MEPLALEFDLGNYRHTQVERHGTIAIYEQRHKEADVTRFEVVRIRIQREHTWPTGQTTPEKEAYPGATSWGRLGFTCFSLAEAQALAATLVGDEQDDSTPASLEESAGRGEGA
jgi:hypothetical protein